MAVSLKTSIITIKVMFIILMMRGSESQMFPCGSCICNKGKTFADCAFKGLKDVPTDLPPTIISLDISNNKITNINWLQKYKSLELLDASVNRIKILRKDDFAELFNLTSLNLYYNKLSLSYTAYPEGVFRHQGKLSKLSIHNNSEVSLSGLEYPGDSFKSLISLRYLAIDGLPNPVFGQAFQNLRQLNSLYLSGHCYIRKLRNETFQYVPNIQVLSLKGCYLTFIEPGTFYPLRHITKLDISQNINLGMSKFGVGCFGLQNSKIKKIYANKINTYHGPGVLLKTKHVVHLKNTNLEELHFDENRIEVMDAAVFLHLPLSLRKLSVKGNKFAFGMYLLATSAMTGLEWVDASWQHQAHAQPFSIKDNPFDSHLLDREMRSVINNLKDDKMTSGPYNDDPLSGNVTIYVAPNVTVLNVSHSMLTFIIPRLELGPNKLKKLDASYNFFVRWEGPIIGLDYLEHVDLSNNYCGYIGDKFLNYLPSVKFVNFSSNYLGYSLTDKSLNNITTVEMLDLSNNKIYHLPEHLFENLKEIKYLDLRFNFLNTWDVDIQYMTNITELDLSNNLFEVLPTELTSQLSSIQSSVLRVYFSNNPLKCNCQTLSYLRWIQTQGIYMLDTYNMTCKFSDGTKQQLSNLKYFLPELEKACVSYVGVMFGVLTVVLLFLVIIASGLVYRYRWKLRYLYYLTLNKHRGYVAAQDEEQNFDFDAFISYADEDRGFVVRDMRMILEETEEAEERFQLCIHHRDFLAGEAIAANIQKAINTSRKTVVILTRNFLKSYWCRYEVEMAKMESIYRGRNTLLIVVMEDIPVKDLPVDIMEEMRKDSYIEFTNDREGQEVFWRNLKRAIRN